MDEKQGWLHRRRGDLAAMLVLAVMTLAVFWQGLHDPADMINEDAAYFFQPYYTFANREIQSGRLPGWNPYTLMGVPYHASLQGSLFYPLRWPTFLMPYFASYVSLLMVHYFLTGAAAYLLMRVVLKVGVLAGLLGAMSIAFGGFAQGHMSHIPYFLSYPWFLLCVLCIWVGVDRGQWRWSMLAGGCVGLMMLACAVHLVLVLAVLLGTYVAYQTVLAVRDKIVLRTPGWRAIALPAGSAAVAMALGVAIGAAQLLPAWAQYKSSARAEAGASEPAQEQKWRMVTNGSANPVTNSTQMVVPFYYGNSRLGYWNEYNYQDMAHYSGVLTLIAAAAGVVSLRRSDRNQWFWVVLAVVGFLVAAGKHLPVYRFLYDTIPGFKQLRCPSRIFWCTEIALAHLAAIGIQRGLVAASESRLRLRKAAVLSVGGLVVLVVAGALLNLRDYAADPQQLVQAVDRNPYIYNDMWKVARLQGARDLPRRVMVDFDPACWTNIAAAVAAGILVPVLVLRGRPVSRWSGGALVLVLGADLLALSFGMIQYERWIDGGRLMAPTVGTPPQAKWLQEHLAGQRYLIIEKQPPYPTPDDQITRNRAMQFDLRYVSGAGGGIVDSPARSAFCQGWFEPLAMALRLGGLPQDRPLSEFFSVRRGSEFEKVTVGRYREGAVRAFLNYLNVAGVKYVLVEMPIDLEPVGLRRVADWTEGRYAAYEVPGVLPMAYFVREVQSVVDNDQALGRILSRALDPRRTAVVAQSAPPETAASTCTSATAEIMEAVPGRWVINTRTDAPAQLVVSEGFDAGWQCRIDDLPVTIYQTNGQLMSVPVPAGQRQVVLSYSPPGLVAGAAFSIAGVLGLILAPIIWRWWDRKRKPQPAPEPPPPPPVVAKPSGGQRKRRRR